MKRKVFFKNSQGLKLCGIISNPSQDKNQPIVILCHGLASNKNSRTYIELEKVLNQNNLSSFRFDFFAHGESQGIFEQLTVSEAVDNILQAIKFLKKIGYKKLALVGSSFGGSASLIAASKTKNLIALALKAPVSNYQEKEILTKSKKELLDWKNKGYRYYLNSDGKKLKISYSFFEDAKNNDGYQAAKKIKIPVLIIHGDKDKIVPVSQSKKTAKILKNGQLVILKGADHRFSEPKNFKKMIDLITEFFIKKLTKIKKV